MSNVLLPFGVPNWAWKSSTNFVPTEIQEVNRKHPILLGYLLQADHTCPVFDPTGPMPTRSDALVKTKKGIRSIVPQERAQAL
eukprot:scaffold670619_cov153-Attheya_sp.AAC.1